MTAGLGLVTSDHTVTYYIELTRPLTLRIAQLIYPGCDIYA